jgi:membrane fusion protein (multidrug efflux system)
VSVAVCPGKRMVLSGVLIVAALSGCGKEQAAGDAGEGARNAVPVTVAQARQQEVRVELYSVGRVVSRNTPQLAAEIDARVVEILVDEGEPVVHGEELIRLDTTALELSRQEAQAGIQQLSASITNEQRRVQRYRDLKTRDVMPQERLDDAEAQLAVYQASMAAAEARLEIVEDRLRKARLLSPVNGVVERRHVSVGDFVKIGTPLLTVTDTVALRVELPFPETVGAQLRPGQKIYVESAVAPGLKVEASVDHIRPQVGAMNRALVVIADVTNPGPWRPQATVEATAVVERRPNAVVVPLVSVVQRPAGDAVYLLQQDGDRHTVRQQLVETGARQDGWIEIRSGIDPGTKLIEEGAHYLSDGASVIVTEDQP